jgi:hypothetical protein
MSEGIRNNVQLLPYLRESKKENVVDIKLSVDLKSECISSSLIAI